MALSPSTGEVLAILEGSALTAIRTGAASGAATDILARPDSRTLAMIGTGGQAATQIEAVCSVRPIEVVWLYSIDPEGMKSLAEGIAGKSPIPGDIRLAGDAQEAARDADVVCTATPAEAPVFADADIKPGTHINAIGAYTPQMCEVPSETVRRSHLIVDKEDAVLVEAGDIIQAIEKGAIGEDAIYAELGEVIDGSKEGRTSGDQVTLFKSVGVGVQDVFAAHSAIQRAERDNLGQKVDLI
jgi:ornithine cyclodeaminase